ncbi:MAG: beta-lactamase hydrolase domain-containing protein [Leptolyngbyaceae cyanobacterium]
MSFVKSLSADIAVADCQLSPEQIQQVANAGFQSVLNLRSPQETGTLSDEPTQVEQAGMTYENIPVNPSDMTEELADQVMQTLDELPKPTLTHCKSGMRSGAMAPIYMATRNNMGAEAAMAKGQENGFDCDAHPQMKQFFVHYIEHHSKTEPSA